MCEACRCCYSRILATDEALDRLQFQLLAIGVVDDFGLGHVRLELRLRDDALELHCGLGVGFDVVCGRRVGLDEVEVYGNDRQV